MSKEKEMYDFIKSNEEAHKEVNELLLSGWDWDKAIIIVYNYYNK